MNTSLILAVAVLKGPFPLLVTPWTEKAELDVPVLVREAEYVDACGVGGIIWPTAGEVGGLDAEGEYARGITALAERAADAARPFQSRLTAICPGRTSGEALARVAKVEAIAKRTGAKMAILARPPDDATNQTMIATHYRALAQATTLPVIIQTYNGKSPQPDVSLIVELAKEHPEIFGWVKEESPGDKVNDRMEQLLSHPEIHGVFSGWGAKGFVYQGARIGTCGCITQRPAYAGLLARVWNRLAAGRDASDPELAEAYAKYLYMINLGDVFSKAGDDEMRGPHLYVLERLGIFRNRLTRTGKPGAWKVRNFEMSEKMKAEVDARFKYALGDTGDGAHGVRALPPSVGRSPRDRRVTPPSVGRSPRDRRMTPPSVGRSPRDRRMTVGLFVDRGCAGNGIPRWAEILDGSPDVELRILNGAAIRAGGLDGLDLLVMPGGRGDWQYESLGDVGAQAIRDYVSRGGKYFGTCCGIAIALNEDNKSPKRLRMLPFRRVIAPNRGGFTATVRFNDDGARFLGIPAGDRLIRYHNGPVLQPTEAVPECSNVTVLATMHCELAQSGPVKGKMYGTPAAVCADYGRGKMLAFNCHPEIHADSRDLVLDGIRALTGREIRLPVTCDPAGRERVGYVTTDLGDKPNGIENYLKLARDPSVIVVPLTDDEVREGYGQTMDRIITPDGFK